MADFGLKFRYFFGCKNLVTYLLHTRDLVLKFSNFRYLGNKGRSQVNVNHAVKLAHLENPGLVQESRLYLLYKPSYS